MRLIGGPFVTLACQYHSFDKHYWIGTAGTFRFIFNSEFIITLCSTNKGFYRSVRFYLRLCFTENIRGLTRLSAAG